MVEKLKFAPWIYPEGLGTLSNTKVLAGKDAVAALLLLELDLQKWAYILKEFGREMEDLRVRREISPEPKWVKSKSSS